MPAAPGAGSSSSAPFVAPPFQDGKAAVSTDEFAVIVAEKAAKLLQERRSAHTKFAAPVLLAALGVVSYLGIANLSGLVGREVSSEMKPLRSRMDAEILENESRTENRLQLIDDRTDLAIASVELRTKQLLQDADSRTQSAIADVKLSLANLDGSVQTRIQGAMAPVQDQVREWPAAHDRALRELEDRLTKTAQANWKIQLENAMSEEGKRVAATTAPLEEGLAQVVKTSREQGDQLALVTLDSLVRELNQKDSFTAYQRDTMVSSVVALASSESARNTQEFASACAEVVQHLTGASQNDQVDQIDLVLWPFLSAGLGQTDDATEMAFARRWSNYIKNAAKHYGRLAAASDVSASAKPQLRMEQFERYVSACRAIRWSEVTLAFRLALAARGSTGSHEALLRVWDDTILLTVEEKGYVVGDLIVMCDELSWRTDSSPFGKQLERVFRDLWLSLEKDINALLLDPELRRQLDEAKSRLPADARAKVMINRAVQGQRPWDPGK